MSTQFTLLDPRRCHFLSTTASCSPRVGGGTLLKENLSFSFTSEGDAHAPLVFLKDNDQMEVSLTCPTQKHSHSSKSRASTPLWHAVSISLTCSQHRLCNLSCERFTCVGWEFFTFTLSPTARCCIPCQPLFLTHRVRTHTGRSVSGQVGAGKAALSLAEGLAPSRQAQKKC